MFCIAGYLQSQDMPWEWCCCEKCEAKTTRQQPRGIAQEAQTPTREGADTDPSGIVDSGAFGAS